MIKRITKQFSSIIIVVFSFSALFTTVDGQSKRRDTKAVPIREAVWVLPLCGAIAAKAFEPHKPGPTTICLNSPSATSYKSDKNTKMFVRAWLFEHPKAKLKPIVLIPIMLDDPKSQTEAWVWAFNEKSNLNIALVRAGMCPAIMMKAESDLSLQIPHAEYQNFVDQVEAAEKAARAEHIGLWSPN
jgi:hypothetical protein